MRGSWWLNITSQSAVLAESYLYFVAMFVAAFQRVSVVMVSEGVSRDGGIYFTPFIF
jgi:hypothetical protein